MRGLRAILSATVFLVTASLSANADVLYQSAPLTSVDGIYYYSANGDGAFSVFNPFTLTYSSSVTSVSVANYYNFPNTFSLNVFQLGSNLPVFSQSFTDVASAGSVESGNILTVDPTSLSLSAGSYLVSFFSTNGFAVGTTGAAGTSFQTLNGNDDPTGPLYNQGLNVAFRIEGTATILGTSGPIAGAGFVPLLGLACAYLFGRKHLAA